MDALVRADKTGVLLVNVGTPDAPEPAAVRRYLREFLGDPRVLDMSALGRWLLLNLIILPLRPKQSAEAYRQIWTPEGSPLLLESLALRDRLAERLGEGFAVELGMRYGNPTIEGAIHRLRDAGATRIVIAPLYPQTASATSGTSVEAAMRLLALEWNVPPITVLPPFFDHPGFIEAFADVGAPVLESFQPDHVLFSFHGLPESHLLRSDPKALHCLSTADCCDHPGPVSDTCYRAQCFATARLLTRQLGLSQEQTTVSFQSRLGKTVWIRPYTEVMLDELARKGVKRLAVFCPAFVADCLETLEEIGIRGREQFREAGGEELVLVPSLNASPNWVEALAGMVRTVGSATRLPVVNVPGVS